MQSTDRFMTQTVQTKTNVSLGTNLQNVDHYLMRHQSMYNF